MSSRRNDLRNIDNDYIVLLDLDFSWRTESVEICKQMWNEGCSIAKISKSLEREIDEVLLLLLDLSRKGKIEKRENGIF